ncbi:unnamed protein product [Leuciscus chuanchicus]
MARVEMFELGEEQGQMMQVLMRHCQTMKRQETRLRLATAVLLATFLATLLWLQFNQQTTKGAFSGAHSEALKTEGPPVRHSVHLETGKQFGGCSEEQPIKWNIINDGNDYQNFKLENQTVLHVFTKGLYLINLRISYRVPYNQCRPHSDSEFLPLEVTGHRTRWRGARWQAGRVGKIRSEVLHTGDDAQTASRSDRSLPGGLNPFGPDENPWDRHFLLQTWTPALDPRFLLLPLRRVSNRYSGDDARHSSFGGKNSVPGNTKVLHMCLNAEQRGPIKLLLHVIRETSNLVTFNGQRRSGVSGGQEDLLPVLSAGLLLGCQIVGKYDPQTELGGNVSPRCYKQSHI